jgi:hypothetical protein
MALWYRFVVHRLPIVPYRPEVALRTTESGRTRYTCCMKPFTELIAQAVSFGCVVTNA